MKNIVLCSDGTGQSGGKGNGTNVYRLFQYVDLRSHEQGYPAQIAFYDDGVGTESFKPFRLLGGMFGYGLSRNIRELYAFLVRNYQPGDRIYLFGFSRGAFTVRSLAGLIGLCGIVNLQDDDVELEEKVKSAFKAYRNAHRKGDRNIAQRFAVEQKTYPGQIECIGVWDTVDAIGTPFDGLRTVIDWFTKIKFHQYDLAPYVLHGYHALAIDDERVTFHPVMWDESKSEGREKNSIEQVWFAGSHSNVGGGYPKQGMAYVSLYWMMRRAEQNGLRFEKRAFDEVFDQMNVHDKLYDSRAGLGAYYRYGPRNIQRISCQMAKIGEGAKVKIHASVFHRIAGGVLGYAPGNFPDTFELVETDDRDPYRKPNPQSLPMDTLLKSVWEGYRRDKRAVLPWIFARKALHFIFILYSLSLLIGAIALNALQAASENPHTGMAVLVVLALWKVISSPIDTGVVVLFSYFKQHPVRTLVSLGTLFVLLVLRSQFVDKTQLRFVRHWASARKFMAEWFCPPLDNTVRSSSGPSDRAKPMPPSPIASSGSEDHSRV